MKKPDPKKQVRTKPLMFFIVTPIVLVFEIIAILDHELFGIIFPAIFFLLFILMYTNEKMYYDDSGITLSNMLGRKFFISWNDVIAVENTIDDPRLTRGRPGIILKITYIAKNGKTENAKFDHTYYSGLYEFMAFYWCNIQKSDHE
ncbi:MAG: hypothetical protein ACI396_01150 [Acutalibacteraceae bacterium]